MEKVSNNDLWERTIQVQIEIDLLNTIWGWLDHTLRKPNSNIARQGKRKIDTKNTGRSDLEADINQTGLSWQ